jgi:hypothetical protein
MQHSQRYAQGIDALHRRPSLAAWVTLAIGIALKSSTILIKRRFRRLSPKEAVFSSSAAQLIGYSPDSYWFFQFTQNYHALSPTLA